jgi:hypothetical protein
LGKFYVSQVRRDLYLGLTAVQRLSVARHPHRPTFLDHVLNITDKVGTIYSMCVNSCFTYISAFLFFSHVTVDANKCETVTSIHTDRHIVLCFSSTLLQVSSSWSRVLIWKFFFYFDEKFNLFLAFLILSMEVLILTRVIALLSRY